MVVTRGFKSHPRQLECCFFQTLSAYIGCVDCPCFLLLFMYVQVCSHTMSQYNIDRGSIRADHYMQEKKSKALHSEINDSSASAYKFKVESKTKQNIQSRQCGIPPAGGT